MQQCLPLAVLKLKYERPSLIGWYKLQQCLPLAVLKLDCHRQTLKLLAVVATVLTACGIETAPMQLQLLHFESHTVATVLTACGIETKRSYIPSHDQSWVATVLTACGIETQRSFSITPAYQLVATVPTACGIETTRVPTRKGKEKYN